MQFQWSSRAESTQATEQLASEITPVPVREKIRVPIRSDTNQPVQSQKQDFGFKKKRHCTIQVAKTKALIRFPITAELICAFVFAQAFCWFSYAVAQITFEFLLGLSMISPSFGHDQVPTVYLCEDHYNNMHR